MYRVHMDRGRSFGAQGESLLNSPCIGLDDPLVENYVYLLKVRLGIGNMPSEEFFRIFPQNSYTACS